MTDAPSYMTRAEGAISGGSNEVLLHRVAQVETSLRDTRERQIRTDENVSLLKEGQAQMSLEMKEVLDELKGLHDDQKRDAKIVSRWVKVAVLLIPVIPTLIHLLGH